MVVWEEVEARTSESIELGSTFLGFMVLACLIASVEIYLGSPILIVGAMVVGPEFGPLAGVCVAVVNRRLDVAWRSLLALAVGFPVGVAAAFANWSDWRGAMAQLALNLSAIVLAGVATLAIQRRVYVRRLRLHRRE